jgi:hypothetical protein
MLFTVVMLFDSVAVAVQQKALRSDEDAALVVLPEHSIGFVIKILDAITAANTMNILTYFFTYLLTCYFPTESEHKIIFLEHSFLENLSKQIQYIQHLKKIAKFRVQNVHIQG